MIFCGSSRVNRRIGACSTSAIEPKTSERRESDSTNFVLGSSRSLRGSHLSTAATSNARFDVRAPFFRRRFVRETFLAAVPLAATRTPRHRDIFFQTFIAVRASAADVANDEKIRAFSAKTSFRASTVRVRGASVAPTDCSSSGAEAEPQRDPPQALGRQRCHQHHGATTPTAGNWS